MSYHSYKYLTIRFLAAVGDNWNILDLQILELNQVDGLKPAMKYTSIL